MSIKPTLLVIDDERGPRESLRFLFKDLYDVICTDSVDHAIEALRQTSPDCIITDIKMPGKTGLDGLREIRAIDADVSIIMLTGFGSLETAQEAIRHGASDYVKKPFDAADMRQIVARHVSKTGLARQRTRTYADLSRLNEELQEELSSKKHLAELGQASSEFIHDIRNPLTVICGYVNILMQTFKNRPSGDASTENARQYLEQMEKSVQRCQEMSQMWRSLSRDDVMQHVVNCNLAEILEETRQAMQQTAQEQRTSIIMNIPDQPIHVAGDNLQLYRMFQNLAGNALQAVSADGKGELTIRLRQDGEHAIVEIRDNGCGIPADKLETIFAPYVSTRKDKGGMGIGLYICRKIVEKHGGTLTLQNRDEGGAIATVMLPIRTP